MEDNIRNEEVEIDLRDVFSILWGRKWLILLTGIVIGLAALLVTQLFITPEYESETKILILTKNSSSETGVNYSDLQTGSMLTKDYTELITARPVAEEVISVLNLDLTYDQLVKKIDVTNATDTRIIAIAVTDPDPYMARDIADEVRKAASSHIQKVTDIQAVNTVEDANTPIKPATPNPIKNTAIGVVIGLFLAIAILIVNYMLNDSIRTSEDVDRYLGLSVLGVIPLSEGEKKSKRRGKSKKSGKKAKKRERDAVVIPDAAPMINDISKTLKAKEN